MIVGNVVRSNGHLNHGYVDRIMRTGGGLSNAQREGLIVECLEDVHHSLIRLEGDERETVRTINRTLTMLHLAVELMYQEQKRAREEA